MMTSQMPMPGDHQPLRAEQLLLPVCRHAGEAGCHPRSGPPALTFDGVCVVVVPWLLSGSSATTGLSGCSRGGRSLLCFGVSGASAVQWPGMC